jgi:uncharacterized membrane protein (DUF485 family)
LPNPLPPSPFTLKIMSDAASETQIRPAAQVMDDHSSIASYDEKEIHPRSKYRDYMNPRRRKYWYLCVPTTIVIVVLVVVLILFVAFPKIAQNTINGSSISVDSASISFENTNGGSVTKRDTPDANSTFILSMNSSLSHTGIFSATIKFDTISVYYNSNNSDILVNTVSIIYSKILSFVLMVSLAWYNGSSFHICLWWAWISFCQVTIRDQ